MSSCRFVPVPLGRWESRLCWAVWIFHAVSAFVIAYNVSQGRLRMWIQHWLVDSSYVSGAKTDLSDPEWVHFRQAVGHALADHVLHSTGFYLAIRFVGPRWVKLVLGCLGILLQVHMTSLQCILILAAFSALVTWLSTLSRNFVVPWVLCIAFVLKGSDVVPFTMENHVYYREFNVYLYGAIKILNFCLHMCKNTEKKYRDVWEDHLVYLAYLPYSMTLIVLFEDFTAQLHTRLPHRTIGSKDLRFVGFFAVRLIVWYFAYEFVLHFIHVHSIFNSPVEVVHRLSNYEMSAVAYVAGQLFYNKYVVMFGMPSLFAYLDGMRPPPPPICISRVSRYSRMWRHFDAGLYQFLKIQVYIPLLSVSVPPVLRILRSLATLAAVFGVVLAWHGAKTHYICWVLLSAAELVIERIGQAVWSSAEFQNLRMHIGERNTRRLIALGMLATVIPGIFGVFFFLGIEGTGSVVFNEVLVNGAKEFFAGNVALSSGSAGFVFLHLLVLGYFFNNVCLDFETVREKKKL